MKKESFILTTGIIFGIVAVIHLLRSVYQSSFMVGNFEIPLWFSWVAVVLLGYLSFVALFKLRKK
jgi:hypothetical protein